MIIAAERVLTPHQTLSRGWVEVSGDKIVAVGAGLPRERVTHDFSRATLIPGLVDVHNHGGAGFGFESCSRSEAARAVDAHHQHGSTTVMASLVAMSRASTLKQVMDLSTLVANGLLAGIHLEGPWLSSERAGAQNLLALRAPTPQEIDTLMEAGNGTIRMVTIAPELPGAIGAIKRLVRSGVVVAVGHTNADYSTVVRALEAGATAGTHLFNAMPALHHRDPGPIAALLEAQDAYVELIADGIHVHPSMLGLAGRNKPDRTVFVSDAMAGARAADGEYDLGGLQVVVRRGAARLASNGAIAGSTLTLAKAINFAVLEAGFTLQDAVSAASTTPSRMLGLTGVGELRAGCFADLVVIGDDVEVRAVMRRGDWLPDDARSTSESRQ